MAHDASTAGRAVCGYRLLAVVAGRGQGSAVLRRARVAGVSGGTILLGRGGAAPWSLEASFPPEEDTDVVLMLVDDGTLARIRAEAARGPGLLKCRRAVAFLAAPSSLEGSTRCRPSPPNADSEEVVPMHEAIVTIVDKGAAETVVEAAEAAGARGATILNARGAGVHETSRLFLMDVEPEKEVVLILAEAAAAPAIRAAIVAAAGLDEPGKGLQFSLPIEKA